MQISIRQATKDDAALLAELNAAVQDIHAAQIPFFFKFADVQDPALIEKFANHLADANTHVYIAEVDSKAVGYILLIVREVPEMPYSFAHSRVLIDQMSVNAEFRSKGVGHALMDKAKEVVKELGGDYLTLNVWAFNEEAIAFYKREGFDFMSFNMWQKLKD